MSFACAVEERLGILVVVLLALYYWYPPFQDAFLADVPVASYPHAFWFSYALTLTQVRIGVHRRQSESRHRWEPLENCS